MKFTGFTQLNCAETCRSERRSGELVHPAPDVQVPQHHRGMRLVRGQVNEVATASEA